MNMMQLIGNILTTNFEVLDSKFGVNLILMSKTVQYSKYLLLIFVAGLSGCFGLFDSGGDHIAGPYYTGWIDVSSSRYIGKRDKNDTELEIVPAYIFAVGHNMRFIVAKQHPLQGKFPNEKVDTRQTNYYVIDLKLEPGQHEKGLYGPMDKGQFDKLCLELNVSTIAYDLVYKEQP
jgi:hypothetical protein